MEKRKTHGPKQKQKKERRRRGNFQAGKRLLGASHGSRARGWIEGALALAKAAAVRQPYKRLSSPLPETMRLQDIKRFPRAFHPLSSLSLEWVASKGVRRFSLTRKKNATTTLELPARACCSPGADRNRATRQRTHGGEPPVNVLTALRFRRCLPVVSAEAGVVNKIRIPAVFSHCFLLFLSSFWQGRCKPASALLAPLPRGGVRVSRRRVAAPVLRSYPGRMPANPKDC